MASFACSVCQQPNQGVRCGPCAARVLDPARARLLQDEEAEAAAREAAGARFRGIKSAATAQIDLEVQHEEAARCERARQARRRGLMRARVALEERKQRLQRRRAAASALRRDLREQRVDADALDAAMDAPLRAAVEQQRDKLAAAQRERVLQLLELFRVQMGPPASIAGLPLGEDAPDVVQKAAQAHLARLVGLVARVLQVDLPPAAPTALALAVLCLTQGVDEAHVAPDRPVHNLVLLVQAPSLGARPPELPPCSAIVMALEASICSGSGGVAGSACGSSASGSVAGSALGSALGSPRAASGDDDDEWDMLEADGGVSV